MTPYQRHKKKWSKCELCNLCGSRNKVVLAKGVLPCDILFIGEAPGASEDVVGSPFVGPAGRLLDVIVEEAQADTYRLAFTNLISCIPKEDGEITVERGGWHYSKIGEPKEEWILACAPRLREFVRICTPKLIVCVGELSNEWTPKVLKSRKYVYESIIHPAAILRMDISQKGLAIQRTITRLVDAVESL